MFFFFCSFFRISFSPSFFFCSCYFLLLSFLVFLLLFSVFFPFCVLSFLLLLRCFSPCSSSHSSFFSSSSSSSSCSSGCSSPSCSSCCSSPSSSSPSSHSSLSSYCYSSSCSPSSSCSSSSSSSSYVFCFPFPYFTSLIFLIFSQVKVSNSSKFLARVPLVSFFQRELLLFLIPSINIILFLLQSSFFPGFLSFVILWKCFMLEIVSHTMMLLSLYPFHSSLIFVLPREFLSR